MISLYVLWDTLFSFTCKYSFKVTDYSDYFRLRYIINSDFPAMCPIKFKIMGSHHWLVVTIRHCKTHNSIGPFKNDLFWLATRLTCKPDWSDLTPIPTCPFCHVYQCWVDWDWGIILIKYLLILLYLICYVLHYSLLFFTCLIHFLFLL